jgi:hypothetical protein
VEARQQLEAVQLLLVPATVAMGVTAAAEAVSRGHLLAAVDQALGSIWLANVQQQQQPHRVTKMHLQLAGCQLPTCQRVGAHLMVLGTA